MSKPIPTYQEENTGSATQAAGEADPRVLYPLQDISLMVKTYSHDLRNILNGMDLDLTMLHEASSDANTREAIKRLQATTAEIGRQAQGLISKYGTETPFDIAVIQLAERWRLDAGLLENGPPLHWVVEPSDHLVYGEAGLIRNLLWEMLLISQRIAPRKPLHLTCRCEAERAIFQVAVPNARVELRRAELQDGYWRALGRLAQRGEGQLLPAVLGETQDLLLQLMLPAHRLSPKMTPNP